MDRIELGWSWSWSWSWIEMDGIRSSLIVSITRSHQHTHYQIWLAVVDGRSVSRLVDGAGELKWSESPLEEVEITLDRIGSDRAWLCVLLDGLHHHNTQNPHFPQALWSTLISLHLDFTKLQLAMQFAMDRHRDSTLSLSLSSSSSS